MLHGILRAATAVLLFAIAILVYVNYFRNGAASQADPSELATAPEVPKVPSTIYNFETPAAPAAPVEPDVQDALPQRPEHASTEHAAPPAIRAGAQRSAAHHESAAPAPRGNHRQRPAGRSRRSAASFLFAHCQRLRGCSNGLIRPNACVPNRGQAHACRPTRRIAVGHQPKIPRQRRIEWQDRGAEWHRIAGQNPRRTGVDHPGPQRTHRHRRTLRTRFRGPRRSRRRSPPGLPAR